MKLKKFMATAIATGLLCSSLQVNATGVPVVDVVGNTQELQHWLVKVKAMG